MSDFTYGDYWTSVDGIIDDIKAAIAEGEITESYEVSYRVNEEVGGSQWVIYTGRALAALQFSHNEDAYFDEGMGALDTDSFAETMSRLAYYAMVADVMERIGNPDDLIAEASEDSDDEVEE